MNTLTITNHLFYLRIIYISLSVRLSQGERGFRGCTYIRASITNHYIGVRRV